MPLRERVFAVLNARENEDLISDDPALIACDLLAMQQFELLDDEEAAELQDYIIEWQESFA